MIKTASVLQRAYNRLYAEFRNYIWNFSDIEALADLETEVYQIFPDMDKMKAKFKKLKRQISSANVYREDEDLKNSFEEFEEEMDSVQDIYANIKSFKEVVLNENDD
ncbi:MAG: hypothetical protein NC320_01925 [Clostridium sp.]|nr:hypothetical protein [Clostridium sp.]